MNRNPEADIEMEKLGYLTVPQAAKIAGKDTGTIYRWRRRRVRIEP